MMSSTSLCVTIDAMFMPASHCIFLTNSLNSCRVIFGMLIALPITLVYYILLGL